MIAVNASLVAGFPLLSSSLIIMLSCYWAVPVGCRVSVMKTKVGRAQTRTVRQALVFALRRVDSLAFILMARTRAL